jgi:hypothetical protein
MGKIYTLVKYEMFIDNGMTVDLMPIPGLFLWHNADDGKYLYSLNDKNGFIFTLLEAKRRAVMAPDLTIFTKRNTANLAIIEVECVDEKIIKFNKIVNFKNSTWHESDIKESELTINAIDNINEIYRNKAFSLTN